MGSRRGRASAAKRGIRGIETTDQRASSVSRTWSEAAGARRGQGWTRRRVGAVSQCLHGANTEPSAGPGVPTR